MNKTQSIIDCSDRGEPKISRRFIIINLRFDVIECFVWNKMMEVLKMSFVLQLLALKSLMAPIDSNHYNGQSNSNSNSNNSNNQSNNNQPNNNSNNQSHSNRLLLLPRSPISKMKLYADSLPSQPSTTTFELLMYPTDTSVFLGRYSYRQTAKHRNIEQLPDSGSSSSNHNSNNNSKNTNIANRSNKHKIITNNTNKAAVVKGAAKDVVNKHNDNDKDNVDDDDNDNDDDDDGDVEDEV